ncbi:MAG: flagellar basal-body rod protein FlgB [Pseudomonadota bacterium]|jgi:flagellar basal-body rod protein FlgB
MVSGLGDSGFDATVGALNTAMNLRLINQNVISSNIANADTPEYKAKRLEFEGALREALNVGQGLQAEATHPEHIQRRSTDPVNPEIYDDPNGVESLDGNTVDRAAEMARLSENQILFDAAAELMKRKIGMAKYAIGEGGGNR